MQCTVTPATNRKVKEGIARRRTSGSLSGFTVTTKSSSRWLVLGWVLSSMMDNITYYL